MKTFMKFSMIMGMALVAILLMSGNVGAAVVTPDNSATIARPGLGFGNAPIVIVRPAPRPFINPFFRFFNPFRVNPFFGFDDDPFFGFDNDPFFGFDDDRFVGFDDDRFIGERERFADD